MRVDTALLPPMDEYPFALVFDRYLDNTRLRLRRVEKNGETIYKLGKKYGLSEAGEPVITIYLTRAEYDIFSRLPGQDLAKRRTYFDWQGNRFALDTFGAASPLVLCECEAASAEAVRRVVFPPFCVEEVTGDERYFGSNLAASLASPFADLPPIVP